MCAAPTPLTKSEDDVRRLLRAVNVVARALAGRKITLREFDEAGDDYRRIRHERSA